MRQNVGEGAEDSNSIVHQPDESGVYRTANQLEQKTHSSSTHGTFSKLYYMAGHKQISIHLMGLKPHEVQSLTTVELEISSRRKFEKCTGIWKLNSIILNNPWVKEEITREMREYLELKENENNIASK